MPDITYEVVEPANLKLKNVHQDQIKINIDITGAQTDPLTLQQIYGEESLKQCFLARRKNINTLLQNAESAAAKAPERQEKERILKEMNDKVGAQVNTLGQEMQVRANNYVARQKKEVNDYYWASAKLSVKWAYSIAKLGSGAVETGGKVITAVTVPGAGLFITASAIKGVIDTSVELYNLYSEMLSAFEEETEVRKKLKTAVAEVRKLKAPEKVPQSKIDAVSSLLVPYGARLIGIDMKAKELATKLDVLLKKLEKKKFRFKRHQELAEHEVDKWINEIIKLSQTVNKGRGLIQNAKDAVKTASQRAQKDPSTYYSMAVDVWKKLDIALGVGEAIESTVGLWNQLKAAAKSLHESFEKEMNDARMEEMLK